MKQMRLRKFAIATSTIAVAALFSVGWSEQGGLSLSVESAQARATLYVHRLYYNPYNPCRADASDVSWYAVRAYYAGGPWSGYAASGGPWAYNGWDDYAHRYGIGCTPSIVKAGTGSITSASKYTRDKEAVRTSRRFT